MSDVTIREAVCASHKARLRQGDESALVEVIHTYGPWVASAVRLRYPFFCESDVDDILAMAIFRLWQGRQRLDDSRGQLSTLLCHIALNGAADVCRYGWQKARRLEVSLDLLKAENQTAPSQCDDSSSTADPKTVEDLRHVIDALPHSYRQIVLADVAARDRIAAVEYLAEELDVAPGTVRVYRNRAYAAIRKEMQKLGYEVP